MEDNKTFVEETTENVEPTTTEEIVGEQVEEKPAEKTFTQTELNEIVKGAKARAKARVRKEYDRKYGRLTEVLKAGTGKESVEEITDTYAKFLEGKGVKIPKEPNYTAKDIEVLARADADEIIRSGYEEVVEEVDRLSEIGAAKMTAREKNLFKALAEHRQKIERENSLAELGIKEEEYGSEEYQNFRRQFVSDVPESQVYKLYAQTKPKDKIEAMPSMKNGSRDSEKTFYTPEDVDKLSEKDLENPSVMKRVRESMLKWK